MTVDPYQVLGISRDATPEEIKKAYRKKAKEYHPDLHPDDPVAAEKMNQVNEAYDMLSNPEKYKRREQEEARRQGAYRQSSQGPTGGYGSYGGQSQSGGYTWYGNFEDIFGFGGESRQIPKPEVQNTDSMMIRQVIQLLNQEHYERANQVLSQVISSYRDGRWYYLSALAHHGLGNPMMADEQIQKAIRLEPENQTYQQIRRIMRQSAQNYTTAGKEFTQYAYGMDKMCTTFCLAQLFCTFCRCC